MNKIHVGESRGGQTAQSDAVVAYVSAMRETLRQEKTEHTDRHAIKGLLEKMSPAGITVIHEPKRVPGKGAPDFKVRQNGQIVGYVETKPIGTNLREVLKSNQIERYRSLSKNILLTDYVEWIWIKDGNVQKVILGESDDLFASKMRLDGNRASELSALLRAFASTPPQKIATANNLADALASRSRLLRDFLDVELKRQEAHGQGERLFGLFSAFRVQVSETITISEFADAFAQTLSYGLFLSKLNANGTSLSLSNAKQYIPASFKLIQELVGFLDVLNIEYYKDIRWVVDEILSIINGLDVPAVKESLSFRNRSHAYRNLKASNEEEWRLFSRDPFIYFYEDYLSQYDSGIRRRRGVYYTPPPVVNFIVRAADDILTEKFSLKEGLADPKHVTVLDFACGTGTFVVELIQRIMESTTSSAKMKMLLDQHILKNIHAFEYLIAPYTIAHLKLSQYLEDRQIKVPDGQRFNILLTNTLEPLEPQHNYLLPALSEETSRALAVKKNGVLVITGNPPYSGHSQNKNTWITEQVRKYRDGVPELNKPGQGKWLQNDYVKFIRFAQYEMDRKPEGLVAVITDNSYLDNPTFRGMRKSLMGTFNQIYILDLHGNANKREKTPTGTDDDNVFDIKQGVAIALLIKKPGLPSGVWRADVWGRRIEKYRTLTESQFAKIAWERMNPSEPQYLFTAMETKDAASYQELWSIPDIFSPSGAPAPGIVTTHDEFAISFTPEEATAKVKELLATRNEAEARDLFRLCSQEQWNYENAKKHLSKIDFAKLATPVLYQPFDERWTIWDSHVAVHRRERVMTHMAKDNIAISLIKKADVQGEWRHAFVTSQIITHHTLSMKEVNYLFPLYIYPPSNKGETLELLGRERIENLAPKFREWLDKRYKHHFTGEEVMGFIYAVLHAPSYRARYRDLLRANFPRIPFPKSRGDFSDLAKLGGELIDKHILMDVPKSGLGQYEGDGPNTVMKPRYDSEGGRLYINDTQYFTSIPADVWEFKIGGYQVLSKYLKNRKGRALTLEEINNIENVTNVLAFTISQMKRIDTAYMEALPS